MKAYLIDIQDLSDSKEMLQAQPTPVLSWLTWIITVMILIAGIWAYFGEIEEYVKVPGIVRPGEPVSTIINRASGLVKEVYLVEGNQVERGELLYTIDLSSLELTSEKLQTDIAKLEKEITLLDQLATGIEQQQNTFNATNEVEKLYYNLIEQYLTQRALNEDQLHNSKLALEQLKTESQLSLAYLQEKFILVNRELQNLNWLLACVKGETWVLDLLNEEFYSRYQSYLAKLESLQHIYEESLDNAGRLSRLYQVAVITEAQLHQALQQLRLAEIELENYQEEYKISLHQRIKEQELVLQELLATKEKIDLDLYTYQQQVDSQELILKQQQMDMLVQIDEQLSVNQERLAVLSNQLAHIELEIADGEVRAPISGTIKLVRTLTQGDLLSSNVEVATIVPEHLYYSMQLMVANQDIAQLKLGQKIKYRFPALPYQEYGELEGEITMISPDIRVDNLAIEGYYLVEATVNQQTLQNHHGESAHIKTGMLFEAHVITKSKTIFVWFLEKLNFLD